MTEWLIAVESDGRVLLPPTDRTNRATHYRVQSTYGDKFELIPMRLYTEDDAMRDEPKEGVATLNRELYDAEEWDSLQYPCPACGKPKDEGCVTADSRRPLEPKAQNKPYHVRCVHKARINLMKGSTS